MTAKKRVLSYAGIFSRMIWGLMNFLAIGILGWSLWPIPRQQMTIGFPRIYQPDSTQKVYEFPTGRSVTMDFPVYIRLGDIHAIHAETVMDDPETGNQREGCMDFCTLKHPVKEDIWQTYHINIHFSKDISNLWIDPPGETIFPLSVNDDQVFTWKIKAMQSTPAYLKNTVALEYIDMISTSTEQDLIFAKEISMPVVSLGRLSMPVARILCILIILVSAVCVILKKSSPAKEES